MAFNSSSTSLFAGLVVNQATGTTPASVTIPLKSINNITATNELLFF